MTLYNGISARYVNSYHQNNSLLFQFILAEFLEAFTEIQQLDSMRNRIQRPLSSTESLNSEVDRSILIIKNSLKKLIEPTKNYMRLFSSNFSEGLLSKLRTHCLLFLQNSESNEKELIAIQRCADKIWQGSLQAIDILQKNPGNSSLAFASLDNICSTTKRFAKLIASLIQQFSDDENVIFYILRNHKIIDKIYGNRFVAKMFCRIYPKGLKEVQFILVKKYTQRGFENIIPAIYASIREIEASNL